MTLTIQLPAELEQAVAARAAADHSTPDQVLIEAARRDLMPNQEVALKRDLSFIAGKKLIDDEMEAVFWEQRQIEPEIWQ